MCYLPNVMAAHEQDEIGLRELRQHASEVIRRVEAGNAVTVTVNGRAAARIVPIGRQTWRRWEDIEGIFKDDRAAEGWEEDRAMLDDSVVDPWERQ